MWFIVISFHGIVEWVHKTRRSQQPSIEQSESNYLLFARRREMAPFATCESFVHLIWVDDDFILFRDAFIFDQRIQDEWKNCKNSLKYQPTEK